MNQRFRQIALILGLVAAFGVMAAAHDRDDRGRRGNYDSAYQAGYRDGAQHGQADARRGAGRDHRDQRYERGGGGWGSNDQYRDAYRQGYRAGYDAAYSNGSRRGGVWRGQGRDRDDVWNRNGGVWRGQGRNRDDDWNRNDGVWNGGSVYGDNRGVYGGGGNSIAAQTGYQDGLQKGRNDARQNKSFDLNRHDAFKDADHGYHSQYGSKEMYRRDYREAFAQGYRQGFGRGW